MAYPRKLPVMSGPCLGRAPRRGHASHMVLQRCPHTIVSAITARRAQSADQIRLIPTSAWDRGQCVKVLAGLGALSVLSACSRSVHSLLCTCRQHLRCLPAHLCCFAPGCSTQDLPPQSPANTLAHYNAMSRCSQAACDHNGWAVVAASRWPHHADTDALCSVECRACVENGCRPMTHACASFSCTPRHSSS